jgi:hypothetical protein
MTFACDYRRKTVGFAGVRIGFGLACLLGLFGNCEAKSDTALLLFRTDI